MLHATLRRPLRSDPFFQSPLIRHFIYTSRCNSQEIIPHLNPTGEQFTGLHDGVADASTTGLTLDGTTSTLSKEVANGPVTSKTSIPSGATKSTRQPTSKSKALPQPKKSKLVNPPLPKIESFLRQLQSELDSLTLADIESLRSPKIPRLQSPEYEDMYNEAMDKLNRSFNMAQLRRIFDIYSIPHLPGHSQRKSLYCQAILQFWGWKPVAVVREEISDVTQSSEMIFALTSDEAFLLMGKDGSQLMNLAKRYGVHLSFIEGNPLSLKAVGLQGSLKRLRGYLQSFIKDVQTEISMMHLGQDLPFETVKLISRLSGAYLAFDGEKCRISFHKNHGHSIAIAKRLVVQAAFGKTVNSTKSYYLNPNLFFCSDDSSSPSSYSLYPFTPQRQLSWEYSSRSTFRLRRVARSLENGVIGNRSLDVIIDPAHSPAKSFIDRLDGISDLIKNPNSKLEVSACTGHFLFLSSAQGRTLLPPISGHLGADDIVRLAQESPGLTTFESSIPASVQSRSAYKGDYIRKLTFIEQRVGSDSPSLPTFLQLELPSSQEGEALVEPKCFISQNVDTYILLPDRGTDMKISVTTSEDIAITDLPSELRLAAESEANSQPHTVVPMAFTFRGARYNLYSEEYVHREVKTMLLDKNTLNVVTESFTDTDIDHHRVACKIICANHDNPDDWDKFLVDCDRLVNFN